MAGAARAAGTCTVRSWLLRDSVSLSSRVFSVVLPWVQSILPTTRQLTRVLGQGPPHVLVFVACISRCWELRRGVGAVGTCRYFGRILANSPSSWQGFGQEGPERRLRPLCPLALQREDAGEHREYDFSLSRSSNLLVVQVKSPHWGARISARSQPCSPASPARCPWGGVTSTWRGGMKPLPLQVVKKSCYPRWNETFEFELAQPAGEKLCVEVWDWDLVGRNDFLGKVSPQTLSPLPGVGGPPGCPPDPLLPSPPRWCSASRGWRRPGRRRAGSGCGRTSPSQGRRSECRHGGVGVCWGGPGARRAVGVIPGKHPPFGGAAPGNALVGERGKCRAAPPACPGFPGLLGHLLLGEVLLPPFRPSLHPSPHPPCAPAGAEAAWARCSCR